MSLNQLNCKILNYIMSLLDGFRLWSLVDRRTMSSFCLADGTNDGGSPVDTITSSLIRLMFGSWTWSVDGTTTLGCDD